MVLDTPYYLFSFPRMPATIQILFYVSTLSKFSATSKHRKDHCFQCNLNKLNWCALTTHNSFLIAFIVCSLLVCEQNLAVPLSSCFILCIILLNRFHFFSFVTVTFVLFVSFPASCQGMKRYGSQCGKLPFISSICIHNELMQFCVAFFFLFSSQLLLCSNTLSLENKPSTDNIVSVSNPTSQNHWSCLQ